MNEILSNIIPIILLIGLGIFIRQQSLVNQETIDGIKKLIVTIALPSLLFVTFLNIDLQIKYLYFALATTAFLAGIFGLGFLYMKIRPSHYLLPFFMVGFSYGTLGIPLFSLVYGRDNLRLISFLGVGHALFLWSLYFPMLVYRVTNRFNQKTDNTQVTKPPPDNSSQQKTSIPMEIIKSPIIIAIVIALTANILGLRTIMETQFILKGVYQSLELLASLCTPLIFIITGHGLKLNRQTLVSGMKIISLRYLNLAVLGSLYAWLVLQKLIPGTDLHIFPQSTVTFFLMPPQFILPLLLSKYGDRESETLSYNILTISTITGLSLFIIFTLIQALIQT